MTEVAARQGLGLSAPPSRQDVISALLTEYGNSFGRGDGSPSAFSPVLADKELPPPPPRSDSLKDKPLPAVQRAEQRMSMKFQLRLIEDAPLSPNSARKASPEQRSRKKIPFRSLSRDGKPPSLNLITSNGSTAIVPPTPLPSQSFPGPSNLETKDLPSPPPPPPVKSERRSNAQRAPTDLPHSKAQKELARNDSLTSPRETHLAGTEEQAPSDTVPAVKRKALPAPAAKKFMSLAALGTGPRGGKGGPLPPTSAPRKKSNVENSDAVTYQERSSKTEREVMAPAEGQERDTPVLNHLPPTPEEDKITMAAPAPPRKVFTALGLPSNPRAKGGPISPKHVRGKSSTGFSLLKAQRPAPPIPTMKVETLTPEMTPSPTLKPEMLNELEMSPVSPLPPPSEQRRPFSFEPISAPKVEEQPAKLTAPIIGPSVSLPPAQSYLPIRPTSLDLAEVSPVSRPSTAPAPAPQLETKVASPVSDRPASPAERAPTPPPFTPLTRAPIPLPQTLIPAITSAHLQCYTAHKNNIWSNNTFQPMGCMVCQQNDRERKWCCTWCQLRICRSCSEELSMIPGRNLGVFLEEREKNEVEGLGVGNPGIVLSAVYERDEDFS